MFVSQLNALKAVALFIAAIAFLGILTVSLLVLPGQILFGNPMNVGVWVWAVFGIIILFLIFGFFADSNIRTKWLIVIENVPPRTKLVLRYVWNEKEREEEYIVLRSGWVIWSPLFWKKENDDALVNTWPQVVMENAKQVVNTAIDKQDITINFVVTAQVKEDDKEIKNFYRNVRTWTRAKEFISAYVRFALNLISSVPKKEDMEKLSQKDQKHYKHCTWKGDAMEIAGAHAKQIEAMGAMASNFLLAKLDEDNLGLTVRVKILNIGLSPILRTAQDKLVGAEQEKKELVIEAQGQRDAMKNRAEGIKELLQNIVPAGGDKFNPTLYVVAESLAANFGGALRDMAENLLGRQPTIQIVEKSSSKKESEDESSAEDSKQDGKKKKKG